MRGSRARAVADAVMALNTSDDDIVMQQIGSHASPVRPVLREPEVGLRSVLRHAGRRAVPAVDLKLILATVETTNCHRP